MYVYREREWERWKERGRETSLMLLVCTYMYTPSFIQESALQRGVDVVCATPGRLNDHFERGNLVSELEPLCTVYAT